MTIPLLDLGSLATRVEHLERQNRRLKHGALLGLLAVAGILLIAWVQQRAAADPPHQKIEEFYPPSRPNVREAAATRWKTIETERFLLRDGKGQLRGEWTVTGDGAVNLVFYDDQGKARTRLGLDKDGQPLTKLAEEKKSLAVPPAPRQPH